MSSLGYSHHPVLKDITLKASPGEMVGLIGPNGSGKSTIIKALSRVIRPTAGEILVDGRDISQNTAAGTGLPGRRRPADAAAAQHLYRL